MTFEGHLADNLLFFGRVLRAAGLPIGTGQILDAVQAVNAVGVEEREGVYWALAACFVRKREELATFDEAFERYFRDGGSNANTDYFAQMIADSRIPKSTKPAQQRSRRVEDAMSRARARKEPTHEKVEFDVLMTASEVETLRTRDFEKMSADEVRAAEEAIRRMLLRTHEKPIPLRRWQPRARGTRLDMRRMVRASLRTGRDDIPLRFRAPKVVTPPLVALCDISGSMERYSRMVLHFLHALTRQRPHVSSFVFGTRLTNITRRIRERDVDEALSAVGADVKDWAGGTRIGESLRAFNKQWSRRVLAGRGAVVLLITDGLERGEQDLLRIEAARLRRSCKRVVWLNPLLRYEGFEPLAAGVKTLLANVDELRAVHHLESLEQLAMVLSGDARNAHV